MYNTKRHIGFICNEHPEIGNSGGIGSFTKGMSKALVEQGYLVTIFGVYNHLKDNIIIQDEGSKVIGIPYLKIPKIHWELNRWRLMRLITKENRRNNLSILEIPDYQGWLRKLDIDIPKIIRFHSPQKVGLDPSIDLNSLPRSIQSEAKSLFYANYYCACGESVAEAAKNTYVNNLSEKSSISIIHNSVDTNYFQPITNKDKNDLNIVFAGRLAAKKGVIELVKSWENIIHKFPQAKLILAGRDSEYGKSKSMIDFLYSRVPEKIKNTIIYKGFINSSKLLKLFQDSTLCIFPSHREAFSVVVLEAMATQTPVIYSKIGPGYEIIKDGYNGLLCNPHDPIDIADKIIKLLINQDLMNDIGKNARNTIIEKFSIGSIIKKNIEYYDSCINDFRLNL